MLHGLLGLFRFHDVLQVDATIALHDDTGEKVTQRGFAHADVERLFGLHLQIKATHGQRFPGQQIVCEAHTAARRLGLGQICRGIGHHRGEGSGCAGWLGGWLVSVRSLHRCGQGRAHAHLVELYIALNMHLRALGQAGKAQLALEISVSTHQIYIELVTKIRLKSMQWQAQCLQLTLSRQRRERKVTLEAQAALLDPTT